jgi:hypothetical protein
MLLIHTKIGGNKNRDESDLAQISLTPKNPRQKVAYSNPQKPEKRFPQVTQKFQQS